MRIYYRQVPLFANSIPIQAQRLIEIVLLAPPFGPLINSRSASTTSMGEHAKYDILVEGPDTFDS